MTTTADDVHAKVLGVLLDLVGQGFASQIRIVSRLYNDLRIGGAAVEPAIVFIPDLHLMSREGDDHYPYGFRRIDAAHGVDRGVLLEGLLDGLVTLREELGTAALRTVQLGDFLDLWREHELSADGLDTLVGRVIDDNRAVFSALVKKSRLGASVVVGNHDQRGPESVTLGRALMSWPFDIGPEKSTLLALHGHLYDPLEQLMGDELTELLVERFGPLASARTILVDRTAGGQTPDPGGSEGAAPRVLRTPADGLGLPDWINIWMTISPRDDGRLAESHSLLPEALEFAAKVRAGKKRTLTAAQLDDALPELRTIVMGHSHVPRICVHRDAAAPEDDLVLMDCGAWIENSQFAAGDVVPSCHVGVLCGGDARIYQIDPSPSLYFDWV